MPCNKLGLTFSHVNLLISMYIGQLKKCISRRSHFKKFLSDNYKMIQGKHEKIQFQSILKGIKNSFSFISY